MPFSLGIEDRLKLFLERLETLWGLFLSATFPMRKKEKGDLDGTLRGERQAGQKCIHTLGWVKENICTKRQTATHTKTVLLFVTHTYFVKFRSGINYPTTETSTRG